MQDGKYSGWQGACGSGGGGDHGGGHGGHGGGIGGGVTAMATVAVMLVVTAAVTAAVAQWWWQGYRAWMVWGGWCGVVTVQGGNEEEG